MEGRRQQSAVAEERGVAVYFSPDGGCTSAIVAEIGAAKASVFVQAYRLTSVPIAKALSNWPKVL
jgi:hypothetical protein